MKHKSNLHSKQKVKKKVVKNMKEKLKHENSRNKIADESKIKNKLVKPKLIEQEPKPVSSADSSNKHKILILTLC